MSIKFRRKHIRLLTWFTLYGGFDGGGDKVSDRGWIFIAFKPKCNKNDCLKDEYCQNNVLINNKKKEQ